MDGKKDKMLIQATLSVPDGARLLHEQVCNLHDEAAASFAVKWGFFDADILVLGESDRATLLATLLDLRNTLRAAWKGEPHAIETIRLQAQASTNLTFTERGQLEIVPANLWSLACLLFLHSYAKGKLAFCANPECHSPFYVRIKRTQKFCTEGPCVLYARRQNAQTYWDTKGKARREATQAKAKRRKAR